MRVHKHFLPYLEMLMSLDFEQCNKHLYRYSLLARKVEVEEATYSMDLSFMDNYIPSAHSCQ
jgi:hypothetical protein